MAATLPSVMKALSAQERSFVIAFVDCGNAKSAKMESGYGETTKGQDLLRQSHVSAAIRYEVARRLATEGAQIGYGALKRIAQDLWAPAAAQVSAAKALLQAAGLLEAPQEGNKTKSINDMDREELRDYISKTRAQIEQIEAGLAAKAQDITPAGDSEPGLPHTQLAEMLA